MKKLLILLTAILTSCSNKNGVKIIVYNGSYQKIDSVRVSTSDKKATIKFIEIDTGRSEVGYLDMGAVDKSDGDYLVQMSVDTSHWDKNIGYYSNGLSLDEKIEVIVLQHNIVYQTKTKTYHYTEYH